MEVARTRAEIGGAEEDRTPDLVIANDALSQLSYGPGRGNGFIQNRLLGILTLCFECDPTSGRGFFWVAAWSAASGESVAVCCWLFATGKCQFYINNPVGYLQAVDEIVILTKL